MMRITNGMMMNNTKTNINGNKVSVDRLNTQMSTQKKLTKPSDNALIAIRSLRLNASLSAINQYYENNIPDAQSWMEVTETALTNMKDIVTEAYRLSVNGATDTLTEDDRNTILTQLKNLSSQLYSEADSDYAGRTVFSGYKTNETVTFNKALEASNAKYQIEEKHSYEQIEETKYYADKANVPTAAEVDSYAAGGVTDTPDSPEEISLYRVRLAYDSQDSINSVEYNFPVETTSTRDDGTVTGNLSVSTRLSTVEVDDGAGGTQMEDVNEQTLTWRSINLGTAFTYYSTEMGGLDHVELQDDKDNRLSFSLDAAGKLNVEYDPVVLTKTVKNNGTTQSYTNAEGEEVFRVITNTDGSYVIRDSSNNRITVNGNSGASVITDVQGNTVSSGAGTLTVSNFDNKQLVSAQFTGTTTTDTSGNTINGSLATITTSDKAADIENKLKVESMTAADFEKYLSDYADDPDGVEDAYKDTMIYLADSGEVILGTNLAQNMTSERAGFAFDYDKNGFRSGEVRPEMYYNCTNKTDPANPIVYTNYDENDSWIYQNIDYQVSSNQTLNVNTQIRNVINSDCYRDMEEMTMAVQNAIDAHSAVTEINKMLASSAYDDPKMQEYLKACLNNAEKQAAYADDFMQKKFSSQISRFEKYLSDVNLAITDSGSRGERLNLTKNRMANQQTTFTELQSSNDDAEMSDITIDYTSAYTAYQASLQAAGKISDMSLLDYI